MPWAMCCASFAEMVTGGRQKMPEDRAMSASFLVTLSKKGEGQGKVRLPARRAMNPPISLPLYFTLLIAIGLRTDVPTSLCIWRTALATGAAASGVSLEAAAAASVLIRATQCVCSRLAFPCSFTICGAYWCASATFPSHVLHVRQPFPRQVAFRRMKMSRRCSPRSSSHGPWPY